VKKAEFDKRGGENGVGLDSDLSCLGLVRTYMFLHVFEYGLKYPPFPFMFWILLEAKVLSDLIVSCQP